MKLLDGFAAFACSLEEQGLDASTVVIVLPNREALFALSRAASREVVLTHFTGYANFKLMGFTVQARYLP